MAILQISKIQNRRGRKLTSTGMPQLASGELGWAIDTQEMYIGNGSVSEGAPAVGNTKILTEHDNIFDLVEQYTYKPNSVLWGSTVPFSRSLQSRLDDFISITSFGATGDGTDQTVAIQTAVSSLFLNAEVTNRVILYFPPGVYVISETIMLPPYATIRGAGKEKTIFVSDNSDIFKTVNSTNDIDTTTPYNDATPNQPRYIDMSDFTLRVTGSNIALNVVDCVYSKFENIKFVGTWTTGGNDPGLIGILLNNRNTSAGTVETKRNTFKNIEIDGFHYPVYSDYDIRENTWNGSKIYMCKYGIAFGTNSSIGTVGMNTGPVFNTIENCTFDMIDNQGILITSGEYNTSKGNKFFGVGNGGGASIVNIVPCISFTSITNLSEQDYFERTQFLTPNSINDAGYNVRYVPEVSGRTLYNNRYANEIPVGERLTISSLLKFPALHTGTIIVDYLYTEDFNGIVRNGTLTMLVDTRAGSPAVQLNDEYAFMVKPSLNVVTYSTAMQFTASLDTINTVNDTISLAVINTNTTVNDKFTYTIRVKT